MSHVPTATVEQQQPSLKTKSPNTLTHKLGSRYTLRLVHLNINTHSETKEEDEFHP